MTHSVIISKRKCLALPGFPGFPGDSSLTRVVGVTETGMLVTTYFRTDFASAGIPPNRNRARNPNRFLGLAVCRSQRNLHERSQDLIELG
jgi:hypothetical protein